MSQPAAPQVVAVVVALLVVLPVQVVAQLSLPVQAPQALVLQVLALLAKDVVVRVQLLLLVQLALLAQAPREAVVVAQEAVHLLTRSFSAAMAGVLPSPEPPMYTPAPRSKWKPRRRPCLLT